MAGRKAANPFIYGVLKFALFISYRFFFRFQCFGQEKVPSPTDKRGVILAPNHASYLDPPILGISLKKRVTFLAKDYLFKNSFVGWVLRSIAAYPIKSGEGEDIKSIRELIRLLKDGHWVVVFPEGTRTEDGSLRPAETGASFLAAKSGAYIQPVYIDGSFEAFPRSAKWFRRHPIKVYFGEPFIPAEDKELLHAENHYQAVGEKIMARIKELKAAAEIQKQKV